MEANKKILENLKNLFSDLIEVQNDINELYTSNVKEANVDLGTKNVTDGNAEAKVLPGTNFNQNVSQNVHYLSNSYACLTNITHGCSTPYVVTESNVSYENVPHDLWNANSGANNVIHGYSTPELVTGSNVSGNISYGNVSQNVHYLSNSYECLTNITHGCSTPDVVTESNVSYENVPHDLWNANSCANNVTYGYSTPELVTGSNVSGNISYRNMMEVRERTNTDANHRVMNVALPNKRTFNERRLEQIMNKESHVHSVKNYFYYLFDDSDVPFDNSHPSNGANDEANANIGSNNVNDGRLIPELVTGSNVSDINYGNVPHDVHYLSNAANNGVNANSGSTNVTHGYFTPELVTESAVSDISYGNACDTLNLDSESPAADLIGNAKMTEKLGKHSSRLYHSWSTNVVTDTDTVETDVSIEPDIDVTSLNDTSAVQPNLDRFFEQISIAPRHGCDNSRMFVPTSDGKSKKYCCVYCRERFSKLVPHLQVMHKNEPDVIKFRNESPRSKLRGKIIAMIRKKGQYEWNNDENLNKNEFAPSRRPNTRKTGADYLTCANCFGQYRITVLTRHWNECTNNSFKGEQVANELGRAIEGRCHADACDDLRTTVFTKMRDNEAVRIIRFDWLIVAFGNDLCLNYSPHYQQQLIRTSLRKAGKVLLAAKSISPEITDFQSLYHVKHCNTVTEAIRKVAGFDHKLKQFKSPGTASTSVTLMNAIGEVLVIESMKLDDSQKERNAERFLKVFQKDVKAKINKIVAVQQAKARRRRTENIPSTEDINRLFSYLDRERQECFIELSQKFSYQKWLCLSELTMISILLFNRRRVGEMQNITNSDFEVREMIDTQTNSEIIPADIKELIKSRMKIRGKLARTVPVLLKHDYDACIELLLLHRKNAGISDKNDFLFALPTKSKHIKTIAAGATIRAFSKLCGAENPSSLRATKLRKHMASFCATLNLSDNDVTNVANFMGHDDKIHRDYYRHNTLQRELVQMTILLEGALGIRIITPNPDITQVATEPAKNQKRKQIINLSNEISSDEEISDEGTSDEDERSDDEAKTKILKANDRAKITKTKTSRKGKKTQNGTVTTKASQKRKYNRAGTKAMKANEKRNLLVRKRTKIDKQ